jgi:hypothetical protein
MTFMLSITGHTLSASWAEHGNADDVEVTAQYLDKRTEAHKLLDNVLDTLGVEEEK